MTDWNKLISEYRDLEKQSFEEYCSHSWNYANISGWEIKKFAYAVKQICAILTGIPVGDFEKEEVKSSTLGEEWKQCFYMSSNENKILLDRPYPKEDTMYKYCNLTVRELLQKVGTDAMRDVIHPNVWVNALFSKYYPKICSGVTYCALAGKPEISCNQCPEYPNWLISDVRFPNEATAIKDRDGIAVRVHREHIKDGRIEHESETALDNYSFDYVIENDSDIPSLIEKVNEMLIHFKLL